MNFHDWLRAKMLVFPFDIKKLNPLNLNQGERPNWKNYDIYYHTKFTKFFQIYAWLWSFIFCILKF